MFYENSYVFQNKKGLVRRVMLLYIFVYLFIIWPNRGD